MVLPEDIIGLKELKKSPIQKYGRNSFWKFFVENNYSDDCYYVKNARDYNRPVPMVIMKDNSKIAKPLKLIYDLRKKELRIAKTTFRVMGNVNNIANDILDLTSEVEYLRKSIEDIESKPHSKCEVLSYATWSKIVDDYYKIAVNKIIEGEVFHIGNVGKIRMLRCERNFLHNRVDFNTTKLYRKEGKIGPEENIYFTDSDYIYMCYMDGHETRITDCKISKSSTDLLYKRVKENPFLKTKYEYKALKSNVI